MSAYKDFNEKFSTQYLQKYFFDNMMAKCTVGVDRVNFTNYKDNIKDNSDTIERKVKNGSYNFSRYKEVLILKGKNKPPRPIYIPTIRDKIVLSLLKEILFKAFFSGSSPKIVQTIIGEITEETKKKFDFHYLKYDLSKFYDTLDHDILMKKIKTKIRKKEILSLIAKAIKNSENKGVPQGLPISNILASIYMIDFDVEFNSKPDILYFRYVDDILIFCSPLHIDNINNELSFYLEKKLLLSLNHEKFESKTISEGLTYLGYHITKESISIKKSSILKLELSIEKLFLDYTHCKNSISENLFIWKLNLRITGCIVKNKKYGWLFFFSQINEESLYILFHLDNLIQKYITRFSLQNELSSYKLKKFVKSFHELNKNLHNTTYIPNFDKFNLEDKKNFLVKLKELDISKLNEYEINKEFDKIIFQSIKDLEKDIQSFS